MYLLYPAYRSFVSRALNIWLKRTTRGTDKPSWKSSLKPLDIEFMRRLHTKVNLIPVIAKADTLTDDEVTAFKRRVS
jgi:hypothetical protein